MQLVARATPQIVLVAALAMGCGDRTTELVTGVALDHWPPAGVDPSKVLVWYDARYGTEFREGGLAIWKDRSPAAREATQSEVSVRPDESRWPGNDLPVPQFATDDSLTVPQLDTLSDQEGVTLVVMARREGENAGSIFEFNDSDGRAPLGVEAIQPNGLVLNLRGTLVDLATDLPNGQPALVVYQYEAMQNEIRVNGVSAKVYRDIGPFPGSRRYNQLGGGFTGQIAFAALLQSVVAASELSALERDLAADWKCCDR